MTPSPAIAIRPATLADSQGILNCLESAFAPYRRDYTAAAYADTVLSPESLQRRFAEMQILVAVCAGEVVGTIACGVAGPKEGHLRGMAVLPDLQGHGIAKQLLLQAESALQSQGCSRVTLDTTAPLQRAIQFYEREGYRLTGRQIDFFGMPLFEYAKPLQTP
jgi:ribosomal protein S18 acetylase RimI-like enzyme